LNEVFCVDFLWIILCRAYRGLSSKFPPGVFFCAHNAKDSLRTLVRSTLIPRWRPTDVTAGA
jgi:hypothetical protein